MRRLVYATVAATALAVGALAVAEVPEDPEAAVEFRQENMRKNGAAVQVIGGFVRDGAGSFADVQAAAGNLGEVAALLPNLFPEGTGQGVGDSRALALIWEDEAGFAERVEAFQMAVANLVAVTDAGDEAGLPAAFGPACRPPSGRSASPAAPVTTRSADLRTSGGAGAVACAGCWGSSS